jgi:formylglycine-generating enzyme required for sulfatase activity
MTVSVTHTGASVSPASGDMVNFGSPQTFMVTAADGSTQGYTVTVNEAPNPAKAITAFSITGPVSATGSINEGTKTITVSVPYGTPVNNMTVSISHTGASVSPVTGATVNFGSAQTFTVTAADTTTQAYTATVTITPPTAPQDTVTVGGVAFKRRFVPAGSFQRDSDPANISVISAGYWMGETEVTQELWAAVMGSTPNSNPSSGSSDPVGTETQNKRPVEAITWYDAIEFCNELSLLAGKDPVYTLGAIDRDGGTLIRNATVTADWSKNGYRLPTEMEWMWAAMGATYGGPTVSNDGYGKSFAGSNGSNSIGDYAWHLGNSSGKTHEVGKKAFNELGLFDMTGNVREYCWDWYGAYPSGTVTDYRHQTASDSDDRIQRGAGMSDDHTYPDFFEVGYRFYDWHDNATTLTGLRVVCK